MEGTQDFIVQRLQLGQPSWGLQLLSALESQRRPLRPGPQLKSLLFLSPAFRFGFIFLLLGDVSICLKWQFPAVLSRCGRSPAGEVGEDVDVRVGGRHTKKPRLPHLLVTFPSAWGGACVHACLFFPDAHTSCGLAPAALQSHVCFPAARLTEAQLVPVQFSLLCV